MTDRNEADALARELVASGWQAPHVAMPWRDPYGGYRGVGRNRGAWPALLHPLWEAVLAVQAMEAGATIQRSCALAGEVRWIAWIGSREEPTWESDPPLGGPLGIVAARALIAIKGGG